MQSDSRCEGCNTPVRRAVRLDVVGDECEIDLDPVAAADGDVWVEWFDCGVPYVLVEQPNRPIPSREPFRYRMHDCS